MSTPPKKKKVASQPPKGAAAPSARNLIFISWAGEISHQVAEALKELLQATIQATEPWLSSQDIDKGARWRSEVQEALEGALAGIVVLTPSGLTNPWMLFEAGALSNKGNRVYTYLFGLEEVADPLAQFQRTRNTEEETLALMRSINGLLRSSGIPGDRLVKAFKQNWQEFQERTGKISEPKAKPAAPPPSESMAEVLSYLREQSKELAELRRYIQPVFPPSPQTLAEWAEGNLVVQDDPMAKSVVLDRKDWPVSLPRGGRGLSVEEANRRAKQILSTLRRKPKRS